MEWAQVVIRPNPGYTDEDARRVMAFKYGWRPEHLSEEEAVALRYKMRRFYGEE